MSAPGPLRILVLGHADRKQADAIADHLLSFGHHSRHQVRYIDPVGRPRPDWIEFDAFSVIVIHYSVYLLSDYYLGPDWRSALRKTTARKVLFLQDEYRRVLAFHHQIRLLGIDLLYTCFPPESIPRVYPGERLPGLRIRSTLTGWIPHHLETMPDLHRPRKLDVGYRSRGDGLFWLGELFHDKGRIGREFQAHARGAGLRTDISLAENDRLYGPRWLNFLRDCRVTLGSESGASVIDFTGEIEERTRHFMRTHPHADFYQTRQQCFPGLDHRIPMGQISPRIFESIACGCALVLFPGQWSGILQPDRHYILLNPDFSNVREVIERIRDREYIRDLARRCWQEIIGSGRWSTQQFVAAFDEDLQELVDPSTPREPAPGSPAIPPGHPLPPPLRMENTPAGSFRLRVEDSFRRGFCLVLTAWYYAAFRGAFYLTAPFMALKRRNVPGIPDMTPIRQRGRDWLNTSRKHWLDWQMTAGLAQAIRFHYRESHREKRRNREG